MWPAFDDHTSIDPQSSSSPLRIFGRLHRVASNALCKQDRRRLIRPTGSIVAPVVASREPAMARIRAMLIFTAALLIVPVTASAQVCRTCPSFTKSTSSPIKKLASLVGCWVGKREPDGLGAKISYEMGSERTALLETIWIENNPTMYTMYYLDGDVGMAHHFCSYGNQLRMRAEVSDDPNVLFLKMIDATNLKSPDDNHMTHIKYTFRDEDHFDVEWGLHHNGRDIPQPYVFRRVGDSCAGSPNPW
jgi:hypothetical protein